jgi:predicted dehydrogenase
MNRARIAVIGLGKMGLLHASIMNMMPNVDVVALCDKSYLLRKFVSKIFKKAQVVGDFEHFTDLDLDSIYIATPIPIHFPLVKRLYLEKVTRNLFVEKTLAADWDQARELVELAKTYEGVNMVGYMKRFSVTFQKAKEILNQGTLGELTDFDAFAFSSDFSMVNEGSKAPASRGGVLGDLGSHAIDLAHYFFGDFEVESAKLESLTGGLSEDSARFKVKKSLLEGQFNVSWCNDGYRMPSFGLNIKGRKGNLNVTDDFVKLDLSGNSKTWFKHDLHDHVKFLLGDSEYYREDEYFISSLLSGNATEPSFLTASKVDYTIDQIKKKAGNN